MSEPDGDLRDALRDLIPGYTGPVDPLPRVVASVRRRRSRQRVLLAVGGAGTAVALVLAGPALMLPTDGGTRAGSARASAPTPEPPPGPPPTGSPATPGPPPTVFPVGAGTVEGTAWRTGAVRIGAGSARCVLSDDALGGDEVLCFDAWTGTGASWAAVPSRPGAVRATRLVGVAVPAAATVRIVLDDGGTVTAPAVGTPVDGGADFFATVVPGTRAVPGVTVLDAAGRPLGPELTGPGGPPCRPRPDTDCTPGK